MKKSIVSTLAVAFAAAALAAPGVASAQDHGRHGDRYDHGRRGPPAHAPAWGRRDHDRHHRWARGQRLPSSYYANSSYYVDYRPYRLPPPPVGYRYVRVNGDIYLTQTRTGLIANVIAGLLQ